MESYTYGVLTVSDSCFNGTAIDLSGPLITDLINLNLKSSKVSYQVVPDDQKTIEESLIYFSDIVNCDVIFTTGGTGFSLRDVTPEATKHVITKEAPQLAYHMFNESLKNTKFAVLSRAVCGIRNQTLIINFPGSKKAVQECFVSISNIIAHAVQLIKNDLMNVDETHKIVQKFEHICPHKTSASGGDDRSSSYFMLDVENALTQIFSTVEKKSQNCVINLSPIHIPSFRASIKDGYALKTVGGGGVKKIIGSISAGDDVITTDFADDECYKINTGAALPHFADSIIQIEDTKLLRMEDNIEKEVEILEKHPQKGVDVREIGSDMSIGDTLFNKNDGIGLPEKSVLASVGMVFSETTQVNVAIISTGGELIEPGKNLLPGKIYDSNTTMLQLLLKENNFNVVTSQIVDDDFKSLKSTIQNISKTCNVIISTGGVSMGDKDYVKNAIVDLGFDIKFGRVNMKPGKPTVFAYNKTEKTYYFGLPGNPVSAFVTFHLFALPCLKYMTGWKIEKCHLPRISVKLLNDKCYLDPRPEYCRATVISKNGELWAEITGNQISSRLKSIVGADVLLHMPKKTKDLEFLGQGQILTASVLKRDFISRYE